MNKKLLAVAVAGALAAPATAMAQVTISGIFKVGIDNYSISGTTTRNQDSEMRITDNSSRLIFTVSEDLGGGLSAIGQWDIRGPMDSASSFANSGNTWVGLRSNSWGTLTLGRHDLHYGSQPDDIASKAGALMAASVSLMDYVGTTAIANATRTPNVVRWDSPNWSGFALTAAYSTAAFGTESDLSAAGSATPIESGSGYNLKAVYTAANWQVGASLWNAKSDGTTSATTVEQDSQILWGYIRFGGFKVGAAVNMAEITVGPTTTADRTSFTIPVSYTTGPHNFYAHYTTADDNDATVAEDGAKMYAFAYVYDLSKRTSVGVTYAKLDNDTAANYNFFTNTGGLGSTNSTLAAGEDGQLLAFTVRHAF